MSNGHICFTGRGTLGGPTDGYIGLLPNQIIEAKHKFEAYKRAQNEPLPRSYPNSVWFKYVEDRKPLLIIYSVRPDTSVTESGDKIRDYLEEIGNDPILGFAIGFPANGALTTSSKKYKVNTTYMRQLFEQTGEEDEEL